MIYAIGDIHGRYDLLQDIHVKIMNHAKDFDEEHTIIFLGDYIDRGPQSKEVLDFLMSEPFDGFRHHFLMGNHEKMFMDAMSGWSVDLFLSNGGHETMDSFNVDNLMDEKLKPYKTWLNGLDVFHQIDNYLFVHAGIDPRKEFWDTHYNILIWIREEFLHYDDDYIIDDEPVIVVHGHTPVAYDKPIEKKFFLEEIEERENPIPNKKHNRINLDTGSCYTNTISAVVIDKDILGYFTSKKDDLNKFE